MIYLSPLDLGKLLTTRGGTNNSSIAYHWAGTTLDLFGANAVMGPKVCEIWNAVYPTLAFTDDDPAWNIIHAVVSVCFSFTFHV